MRFIDAYFTNSERTVVSILWENDKEEVVEETVLAEANEAGWENLLNQPEVTIDKLHERTVNRNREQRAAFEEQIVEIARREGTLLKILEFDEKNTDSYKKLLDIIFTKDENETRAKENLFAFKLSLFEFEAIKNSTDKETKAKIRKAANTIDALELAIQIIKQN